MSTIDLQRLCSWALGHQTFNEQLIAFNACILIIQTQLEPIFEMFANDEWLTQIGLLSVLLISRSISVTQTNAF